MTFERSSWPTKSILSLIVCLILWHSAVYGQSSKDSADPQCSFQLTGSLGKVADLVPNTAADVYKYSEVYARNFEVLPIIPADKLVDLRKVKNGGRENRGIYEARYQEKDILIKLSVWGTKDAIWMIFLNRHGLATRFLGMTPMGNNRWGTVMEKIDGISSKDSLIPAFKEIPRVVRQSMRDQIKRLYELGIYPDDVQFVLTSERATLVDVPLYQALDNQDKTLNDLIWEFETNNPYLKLDGL